MLQAPDVLIYPCARMLTLVSPQETLCLIVAGDSLSLFSPSEVFSLFSEWMPVLSCDLQGIKLHESTLAALMLVETRPFVPCCATYIFTDGSGGASLGGSIRGPPTWAFCVVQQDNDGKFYFAGALSGCVCYNEQHPAFLGACNEPDNQSFTAELTALAWALVWGVPVSV